MVLGGLGFRGLGFRVSKSLETLLDILDSAVYLGLLLRNLNSSCYSKETLVFTMHPYDGNLIC